MASINISAYSKLKNSLDALETAHRAIVVKVAEHAEKRDTEMNEIRSRLRMNSAIESGAKRATGKV